MIVRHLLTLKLKVTEEWLLENFDFFNDYNDTRLYLIRKLEKPSRQRIRTRSVLAELEKARAVWIEQRSPKGGKP